MLYAIADELSQNHTLCSLLAFLTALVVSLVVGAWLIRFFRRKSVIEDTAQPDHAGLNAIQSQKKNVPTMGGLMILAGILIATLLWADLHSAQVWVGMLVLIVLGAAGFADDYIKLKRKPARGLTKTQKLAIQFVLGCVVGCLLIMTSADMLSWAFVGKPFSRDVWNLGWWYIPWCGFVLAATSNAVNLTDGLDGLSGGLMFIAAAALIFASFFQEAFFYQARYSTSYLHDGRILCAGVAGGVLGYLWYNCHSAQIFMGDTGSLALGGLLAYAALIMKAEIVLLVAGAVFFIEELTVAMQIVGFKLTKKRIFPITPIHHYFQVHLKWPEQKIVARAWILGIGILLAVLAFSMAMAQWI